ncbi:Undecaprenyl pyrophosphate synthetase [gamma proteobacterium HdN1]|nr:Undecaprenyl pyrophosphate synthetase [gamma proteobacterium HdN1]
MSTVSSAPDLGDQSSQGVPRHLAIIMDGNNRWARQRGLRGVEGHKQGARAVRDTVENCARAGVEVLTVYAFSSENWRRPQEEVDALMELFLASLADEVPDLHKNQIQLRFIGDLSAFSPRLREKMQQAVSLTANNQRMVFAVAVNYGGHWDITNAARLLALEVQEGRLQPNEITAERMQQFIALGDLPLPDLCIRTGGEQRISNFLLWQLAYAELYFTESYWPDFDQQALQQAFVDYQGRQRRFGRTSEQVLAAARKDASPQGKGAELQHHSRPSEMP